MKLTTAQWSLVAPLVAPSDASGPAQRRRGRPSQDPRAVLEGIFWVMRTGARWADLPSRYPPYQTCHRRFRLWWKTGVLVECLRRLARDLEGEATAPAGMSSRGWQEQTALLLASALGRLVLGAGTGQWPSNAAARGSAFSNESHHQ